MKPEHHNFLTGIAQYVAANPDVVPYITSALSAGLEGALDKARKHAADMETVAVTLASRRYKGADELVKSKLRAMDGKTYFNWSFLIGNGRTHGESE